ncbi:histamine N-methyltransferase-like [Saccoglossus kowalevskii]|uniref:Histamine N-methyltransferase-like n=1 Tax=Saccoglossus kowalevskii TaxID=10224 RepID=A0ABM0N055_SACKO|nr:PREDICTED: histamine N-methyltransferase-like [Saccoglossus kowalevskii]
MTMQSLSKSIYHNVNYFKAYDTLISHITNKDEVVQLWTEQWKTIMKNISFNPNEGNPIRMLKIGAGDGNHEIGMAKCLLAVHPDVHIKIIEPKEVQLQLCKKTAMDFATSSPGLTFDWHNVTFEKYMTDQRETDVGSFHIVVSCHVLCYLNLVWAIDSMYSMARTDGVVVNTMVTGDSTFGLVGKLFTKLTGCGKHHQHSDDALGYLETKTGKIKRNSREFTVDVTDCFNDSSEEGSLLLDFMTQRTDFRRNAPGNVKKSIMNVLRENTIEKEGMALTRVREEDLVLIK